MEKKTPLYESHVRYKGKIIPFGGYLMPVNYEAGILREHQAVREAAGLFDVSHMGEILVTGEDSLAFLNYLLTNDFTGMKSGAARYSVMCYETGGAVDDLLVYKLEEEKYMLCVNASNKDKDFDWISSKVSGNVRVEDRSEFICQIALQGPKAREILSELTPPACIPEKYYSFVEQGRVGDIPCLISKTGYTGEDGFELYADREYAEALWELLMKAGEVYGILPCGLGCRDTLRLEASMPLYGHELTSEITPAETGLSSFIKFKKDFIGKEALQNPPARKRIGLRLIDRGIAREGAKVFSGEAEVGYVTSGTASPTLGCSIAMALISREAEGDFKIEVRGKLLAAEQTAMPFYKR